MGQQRDQRSTSASVFVDGMMLSLGLFGASAYWFVRHVRRHHEFLQGASATPFFKRRQKSLSNLDLRLQQRTPGEISERGRAALVPPIPYLTQLLACFQNPCDPMHNREGYIGLCTAENRLVTRMLAERCMHTGTAAAAFSDSAVYCYNSFLGMPVAREAAAYFLARRFLFPDRTTLPLQEALQNVQPQHVALSAGAAPLLNHLFFALGEPEDACLVPAPYYAAFDNDMNLVAGIIPFAVQQANPVLGPSESELDLAFLQTKSKGLRPRFLLLTNPHNPLAIIYKPEMLRRAVQWARKKGLHTIVDEVYALSTHEVVQHPLHSWQKHGHGFQSIIRVLDNDLGSDVHMVWAASKDFGCSGLRYGLLYSQNALLLEALGTMATFTGVSGPIQYLISELLTDDTFVNNFLDESRDRLVHSYSICTQKLEEMVLPFVPAEAGMFVYVDFSSLLPEKTFEWEEKLSDLMFQIRVVLTPGESQHDATPGMFRICYAWVAPEVLEIAMERLSRLVAKLRRMDWNDLNGRALVSVLYG